MEPLSNASRRLSQASREKRASSNDADRLRKYLKRFGLEFAQIRAAVPGT
jgi:transcriptional regulatory protein RtcR